MLRSIWERKPTPIDDLPVEGTTKGALKGAWKNVLQLVYPRLSIYTVLVPWNYE